MATGVTMLQSVQLTTSYTSTAAVLLVRQQLSLDFDLVCSGGPSTIAYYLEFSEDLVTWYREVDEVNVSAGVVRMAEVIRTISAVADGAFTFSAQFTRQHKFARIQILASAGTVTATVRAPLDMGPYGSVTIGAGSSPTPPSCEVGFVSWGPTEYAETDSTPLDEMTLVKSIPIDFSGVCRDPAALLALEFLDAGGGLLEGEASYGEGGGLEIWVGGTETGRDGTNILFSGEIFGLGPDWLNMAFVLAANPIATFANPNPAGTSWIKFFASKVSSFNPCNCAGIRDYTIQIVVVA